LTVVPVLLYHAISASPPPGLKRFTVHPRQFAEHVAVLRDAGRAGLTVSQFAACLRGGAPLPDRPVLVTFDDGYADFLQAAEWLLSARLPSTLYVTTAAVGTTGMLSRRQLSSLGQAVEVGAHSRTRLRSEVYGSKAELEDVLQRPVRSFAYPHGDHDQDVRRTVVAARFESAAAVKNALSHDRDDPFAIARVTVTADVTARRIEELLRGRGAPTAWAGERRRTQAYRAVRRLRRRVLGATA
jgi:peptidoglycan/xylan/chitin deacetylase (PgdA/CDA1 family)